MKKMYLFLIELLFTTLLVFPYFWPKEKGLYIIPALALFVLCFTLYTWLLVRLGEKAKIMFFILFLPALFATGLFFGFHPVPVACGVAFLFWRGNSLAGGKGEDHDLLLATFSAMAAVPALIGAYTKNEMIFHLTIAIVIIQVMIVLSGRFLLNLSTIEGDNRNKAGYLAFFGKLITPIVLAGSLIAMAMDYIQSAFFLVLRGVAWIFGALASPLLKWSETKKVWTDPDRVNEIDYVERPSVGKVIREEAMQKYTETALIVLVVLALIGLFIYLYKKRNRLIFENTKVNTVGSVGIRNAGQGTARKKKPSPPDNPLRREIFNLEYFAVKNGFGRLGFETVGEWLSRIGAPSNQRVIGLYEDVRYGDLNVTHSELEFARGELKGIKEMIKQKRKEQKKRPKKQP